MSAGGLSYSGLTNYGVVSLPSVESWGTNMNIIRDPPKSITTRKIDKVGENSSITEMIDDSGNRVSEAIQVYPRGINPSVSVSYSNYGNNGGQGQAGHLTGLNTMSTSGRQATLPYTIMRDGAFRPPVRRQEDLLPLSRQPRVWFSAFAQPGFADFSRKMRTCGTAENTKEVITNTIKAEIRPTAVYKLERPLEAPRDVKHKIQTAMHLPVHSGMRTRDITQQNVLIPTKEIEDHPLHAHAQSQKSDLRHSPATQNTMDTRRYTQDAMAHKVQTNVSSNERNTSSLEDILDLSDMPIKDIRTTSHTPILTRQGDAVNYIHGDVQLSRTLPEYSAHTTKSNPTVYKNVQHEVMAKMERNTPMATFEANHVNQGNGLIDHSSRDAKLIPKIKVVGGSDLPVSKPSTMRIQDELLSIGDEKVRMSRMVSQEMQGRFGQPSPFQ